MPKSNPTEIQPHVQFLLSLTLVVAILHFGRPVLIPLAMTALGAFLLTPFVKFLERRALPRIAAVIATALGALGLVIAASWLIAAQLNELVLGLPTYRDNLVKKLNGLSLTSDVVENLKKMFNDVTAAITDPPPANTVVRFVDSGNSVLAWLQSLALLAIEPISNVGVVLVLMIFVLIYRDDLRNRIVRLSGKRFALTTRTLDDLAARISRYLMANMLVNTCYGVIVGLGLYYIGIEYAVLWGALAGMLRFMPYVGPAIGMGMPVAMAFIQFPATDWTHLIYTAAFFALLETTTNVVVEPLMYGYGIGVSIVALLMSAVFWSWVWGPMGLLLSVPITVTLAVLGEYVPSLEVLGILLSDKPALENHVIYYQRLLSGDVDDAESVLTKEVKTAGLSDAYDEIVIRAVLMAERDLHEAELSTPEYDGIVQTARDFLDELPSANETSQAEPRNGAADGFRTRVVGCPVHDVGDEMVLAALQSALGEAPDGEFKILSSTMLASEMAALIQEEQPDAVCLSSLGPGGRRQLRYLCKRIRHDVPQIRIVVGNWGYRRSEIEQMTQSIKQCGADVVLTKLSAAREFFESLASRVATPRPAAQAEIAPAAATAMSST